MDVEFSLETANFPQAELICQGACAIMDPPRKAAEAIHQCTTAGIKMFMVRL
jgi:magnesium-transporting ATPase (P-type)